MAKVCTHCGCSNEDGAKFCATCGESIENINPNNMSEVVNNTSTNTDKKDGFTIAAFLLSIVGFLLCTYCGIPGLIMGIISLNKVNKGEIDKSNKGFAIAAIVLGALAILVMIYNLVTYDWSLVLS